MQVALGHQLRLLSTAPLERWREAGVREGLAARDRLRDGVEAALLAFANGFFGDNQNDVLHERLHSGDLPLSVFFNQLLQLVYRMIFLLTAEDRDLLHFPGASAQARKIYADGYSLGFLRDRAARRSARDQHHDRCGSVTPLRASVVACRDRRLSLLADAQLVSFALRPAG